MHLAECPFPSILKAAIVQGNKQQITKVASFREKRFSCSILFPRKMTMILS